MTGYVVYVDQVLAGNMLLNCILLWTAGRLSQVRVSFLRLILSSTLGSIYALFFFIPGFNQLFSLPLKILISCFMVFIAFAPLPLKRLLACLGFFYLSSFALGGMWLGFIYFLYANSNSAAALYQMLRVIQHHFWSGLLLALLTLVGGGRVLNLLLQSRLHQQTHRVSLVVEVGGRRVEVNGLVDTGNGLRDPLTGYPVIVVEYGAILPILPPSLRKIFEEAGDGGAPSLLSAMAGTDWVARLCLIPFRSVGQEQGMLIGIRPDRVEVLQEGGSIGVNKVVVGIYRHSLGNYQALVHPALVRAA
ncbi:sigma-E processing peptidase SpoIIGA [Desulfofundulus sp.]|uniref:sigma-E processing peptidase SpoIIGA n=1 Tax=Desulfofundulus sp. TaxID=2282750 RepID=UPI003C70B9FA